MIESISTTGLFVPPLPRESPVKPPEPPLSQELPVKPPISPSLQEFSVKSPEPSLSQESPVKPSDSLPRSTTVSSDSDYHSQELPFPESLVRMKMLYTSIAFFNINCIKITFIK